MIVPPGSMDGQSFEVDIAEWVDGITTLGFAADWDGSDRVGLPAFVAENIPELEPRVRKTWDMQWSIAEALADIDGRPAAYWFFGPTPYRAWQRLMDRSLAETN